MAEPFGMRRVQEDASATGEPLRVAVNGRHPDALHSTSYQVTQCRQRCHEKGWKVRYVLKDEGGCVNRQRSWRVMGLAIWHQLNVEVAS